MWSLGEKLVLGFTLLSLHISVLLSDFMCLSLCQTVSSCSFQRQTHLNPLSIGLLFAVFNWDLPTLHLAMSHCRHSVGFSSDLVID